MIILTIRTDKPEAEIGLYKSGQKLAYETWPAHRQLAETIHQKLEALLKSHKLKWGDVQGIVGYQGPGSFTGLRIGLTVANALATGLQISIVGSSGEDWQTAGIADLTNGKNDGVVLPEYGSPAHITPPKT